MKYSNTWKLIRFLDGSMKSVEQAANVFGFISEIFIMAGQTMLNYILTDFYFTSSKIL